MRVTISSHPTFVLRELPLRRKQGTDFFWNLVQEEHSYPDPHAHTLSYFFVFTLETGFRHVTLATLELTV